MSSYIDRALERARASKAPHEKNNVIPLHPLSEAQDLSRSVLKRQLDESLELATLQRLMKANAEFAERLIAVKSPRLAVFHRSFVELGNTIFKEIIK